MIAGQEYWEKKDSKIVVDGYKWFGKPLKIKIVREMRVGLVFLVHDCLVDEVDFSTNVHYEESVWIKVTGGRESSAFCIVRVYLLIV